MTKKVGVVLSGCGVFDGSEIHEAASILIALDQFSAQAICMAPDIVFSPTSHLTRKPDPAQRWVLEESARIARGKILDLAQVKADDLDALVFPGGFGVAKNLSTFAADGASCQVNPQVRKLILDMHQQGKPIALACIAPVLAARVLGESGFNPLVTIGQDTQTAQAIGAMNARHQSVGPTDICIDSANHLVTTPCYMNNVGPATVFEGARKMIEAMLRMVR